MRLKLWMRWRIASTVIAQPTAALASTHGFKRPRERRSQYPQARQACAQPSPHGPHRHLGLAVRRSERVAERHAHTHDHPHEHGDHGHSHGEHGHSHGLVHESIKRSRAGIHAVSLSLAVLGLAAAAQTAVFLASGSIALLADLIHNFGDAGTSGEVCQ